METPSAPQASQIPDLVKIGSVATDTAINVQTDILDPVIFSEREARFVLDNKGILHSNSRITFATAGDTGTDDQGRAFFPAGVGVHSLIQRASLRIGTKTVCEIEDYAHFAAYETTFLPPDAIKEREGVMSGRMMAIAPTLDERSASFASASNSASITESITEAKSIQIDNGLNAVLQGAAPDVFKPITKDAIPDPSRTILIIKKKVINQPSLSC